MFRKFMVIFLLLTAVVAQTAKQGSKPSSPKIEPCVAQSDEKCLSPADYQWLMEYKRKYVAPQEEADRLQGLLTRIQQANVMPAGYEFDGNKLKYVKKQAPPAPAVQPAPAK